MELFDILLIALAAILTIGLGLFLIIVTFFKKVDQGQALIVNTMRSIPLVTFTGRAVIPVIHKAEVMDISLKLIEIDRRGKEGLICKDNIRADIKVAFFVRVNKTHEDVLKVAQAIGCARASDAATLESLFSAKFSEALKTVGKQMEFEDLYKARDHFRDQIIELIGKDLNGYALEDAAIDYLEQTPLEHLDEKNILDAQGIRKIVELTALQHVATNELQRDEQMRIKQKDVQAKEAMLELERQQADAEAKQQREVQNVQAREAAEIERVNQEERQKAEVARIKTEERLAIDEENKERETQVAAKNRERAVAIEHERVLRAQQLEAIEREREVELQRIGKERALEEQRKAIADVVRERIIVDKSVAEEEENIKELRMVSEADRLRKSLIIEAEAEAQTQLVASVKKAEADETAAKFIARQKIIIAEAELEASEKKAQAMIRLSEGKQADLASVGLAKVRIHEAETIAKEKQGMVEARVALEQKSAKAAGDEKIGLADVRVKEAHADVLEKQGMVEARVALEQKSAEAVGDEKIGLADVRVKEAHADVIEKQGAAEAKTLKEKMLAEAEGLVEKMKAMGEQGREFEILRMQLEQSRAIHIATLDAGKQVAGHQADVLSAAMQKAKIDIVGGDAQFLDRIVNTISLGKSIDSLADNQTINHVFKDYLQGDGNLVGDLRDTLSSMSTEDIKNLSISKLLNKDSIKEALNPTTDNK